jgi:hypothetical protein
MNQVASKPVGPIGISKIIIERVGNKSKLPNMANTIITANSQDTVTKAPTIEGNVQINLAKKVWEDAIATHNLIIPGKITDGGKEFKIGNKKIQLGGSEKLKINTKDVSIDTISTPQQQNALKAEIKAATNSSDVKKITNPSTDADTTNRKEKIKNLATGTETTNVTLLDNDNQNITTLDKNRAELNKRKEEVRLAIKNDNLAESQKTALKAEQKALDESLNMIDAVPKAFATQNGAKLEIKNGSNIRSIPPSQIHSSTKLDGYEGMFQQKGDEKNQTTVRTPTVQEAYESFAGQVKKDSGKDFKLGDNQNLVMYREGNTVKFLIVDSITLDNGNRETIVTKPVIANKDNDGKTVIKTPITKSGQDSSTATATIPAQKFTYKNGEAANINSPGENTTVNLVKDGTSTTSFFGADKPGSSEVKQTTTNNYPDFALNQVKITANLADATKYNLELPKDTLRLLNSITNNRAPLSSYFDIDADNCRITGLDKTHLDEMNKELNKRPYLKAAITHLNGGGKLSDVLLSQEITQRELQNTQYAEDINNPRYKALITYITKSEMNDGKAIIKDLQENREILPPWVDLINAGINTP